MAKPKKNGTYLNVCIDSDIYEKLKEVCESAGQTKTIVVERALNAYFEAYDDMRKKLRELETNSTNMMYKG